MRNLFSTGVSLLGRLSFLLVFAFLLMPVTRSFAANDDRVALIIGNDQYPADPLRNAVNDAQAVAKTLSDLGFKVMIKTNADYATMRGVAVEFARVMEGATAAVFYYAGHGIQYRGQNYLVPVDAKLTSEASIAFNAMPVSQILDTMDEAKIRNKFIILDACRNNPFSNVFTSTGLAKIQAPAGTIVSFAAAAGQVAPDGAEGTNSLYTRTLIHEMRDPRLQAAAMFQRVQTLVAQESLNKQLPELHNTPLFRVPFFFAEAGSQATVVASATTPSAGLSGDAKAALEAEFWRSAREGRRIEGYQLYLDQYPSGSFSSLARLEIDRLKRELSQQQVAATPLSPANVSASPVLVAETAVTRVVAESKPVTLAATPSGDSPPKTIIASARSAPPRQASESRGLEIRPGSAAPDLQTTIETGAPIARAAAQPVANANAPGIDKVAAIAPEQRTSLLPPPVDRIVSGVIPFPHGASYNGEYKETKDRLQILHGQGEFTSPDFRYKGEFRDNKKQGKGTYIWANGNRYEGDFVDDEPSGRGKFTFASGDQYEGEYSKGAFNGKGVFISKNGDKTVGIFVNGQAQGMAVYVFANGDKYEGEMAAGKMSGKGTFTTKAGDRWEATFVNDRAHGKGVYFFSNGDRYEGDFTEGAMTGKGAYFYSTGYKSEGTYVNAQLNGEGKFYFNDGGWFEGIFEKGLTKAKGFSVSKDGTKHSATMVDGQVKLDGS